MPLFCFQLAGDRAKLKIKKNQGETQCMVVMPLRTGAGMSIYMHKRAGGDMPAALRISLPLDGGIFFAVYVSVF
jgi:hypothetical protein